VSRLVLFLVVAALAFGTIACGSTKSQVSAQQSSAPTPLPGIYDLFKDKREGQVLFGDREGSFDIIYYPSTLVFTVRAHNPTKKEAIMEQVKTFFSNLNVKDLSTINIQWCDNHPENLDQGKPRWECTSLSAKGP